MSTAAAMHMRPEDSIPPDLADIDLSKLDPVKRAEAESYLAEIYMAKARSNGSIFNEYVLRDRMGQPITQAPVHRTWHHLIDEHERLIIWSHVELGKGLPLTTPIPTPSGWRLMGDIQVGEKIFGSDGKICRVTFATETHHGRPCYRLRFDDGSERIADDEHLWKVKSVDDVAAARKAKSPSKAHAGNGDLCACGCGFKAKSGKKFIHNHHRRIQPEEGWRVLSTAELLRSGLRRKSGAKRKDGTRYDQYKWRIPLSPAVEYPEQTLPIHPYLFGAWLGDGDSSGPVLTLHEDEREIAVRCASFEGGRIKWSRDVRGSGKVWRARIGSDDDAKGPRTGGKLRTRLRHLRVIGKKGSKFIPIRYLTASIEQRRELLAGLLDTDGSVNEEGNVELSLCVKRLAYDALELVRSLGFKASIHEGPTTLNGRVVGTRWRITFTADRPVFHLKRKLQKQPLGEKHGRTTYRSIVAIEPIQSVPTRCIKVDSLDETYLAGDEYTVTHNTSQIAIGRILFEIARNPNMNIALIQVSAPEAAKTIRTIADYIENSAAFHELAPHVIKDPAKPWNSTQLYVRRQSMGRDPSIQGIGVKSPIVGARLDLAILDDVLNADNTSTDPLRREVIEWFFAHIVPRLDPERGRVIFIGNAWHPQDLMHYLSRDSMWKAYRFPVIDEKGRIPWPEKWSPESIEKRRKLMSKNPSEFARSMLCKARDDSDSRFKEEWIRMCSRLGAGRKLVATIAEIPLHERMRSRAFYGVDFGVKKHKKSGRTVLFAGLHMFDGKKLIMNIESGRWGGNEIVAKLVDFHQRYQAVAVLEDNAQQAWMSDFASARLVPSVSVTTLSKGKMSPEFGIESIATDMSQGKWIIPCEDKGSGRFEYDPEVAEWIQEMLYYDPRIHTGDRLMASWFFRQGPSVETRRVRRIRSRLSIR